jgi:hypothetical protein
VSEIACLKIESGICVGWAKRSVPTMFIQQKMVGTARRAFAHPTAPRLPSHGIAVRRTASLPLAYAGRSSIPETLVINREVAAYWITRFRG